MARFLDSILKAKIWFRRVASCSGEKLPLPTVAVFWFRATADALMAAGAAVEEAEGVRPVRSGVSPVEDLWRGPGESRTQLTMRAIGSFRSSAVHLLLLTLLLCLLLCLMLGHALLFLKSLLPLNGSK